jgi:exopolysaccharide biosynthesis WecB/TagA/CpsF family protein
MVAPVERCHLGQTFALGSADLLRDLLLEAISGDDGGRLVLHVNLHSLYSKSKSPALRSLLDDFPEKLAFFEGVALKLSRLICSGELWPDVNGTDLIPMVLERAPHGTRVAVIGGRSEVIEAARRTLGIQYPNIDIFSCLNGYEDMRHVEAHIRYLRAERPDIVLVGLGTPHQEILAERLLREVSPKLVWAIGGFLEFASGAADRAPRLLLAFRLEWFWRLSREPARLWRRTFVEGPWLVRKVMRQLLFGEEQRP